MNPFKCRHRSRDAYWYFREGGMLCVDHAEAFCLAQAQDMMQRSRLDKSVSPDGFTALCPRGEYEPSVTLAWASGESISASAETCGGVESGRSGGFGFAVLSGDTQGNLKSALPANRRVPTEAGVASGPQDSIPLPRFIPPEAGALASHPLPVTAGAAFSADLPIFPERRNATASRVIASSATQAPKSSSDIPNHHQ